MSMMAGGPENADGMLQAIQSAVKASGVDFSQLLEGDLLSIAASDPEPSCPHCKMKLSRLQERHQLGCNECLNAFRENIRDILGSDLEEQRHHRRSSTLMLNQTPEQLKRTLDAQELRRRFDEAVRAERYEQAAALKKLLEDNESKLLEISRQREHGTDEEAERAAIKAFLALPSTQCEEEADAFRQPWLPWAPHGRPAEQHPQVRLSSFVNFSRNLAGYPLPPFSGQDFQAAEEVGNHLLEVLLRDPLFADSKIVDPTRLNSKTKHLLRCARWAPGDFLNRPYMTRLLVSGNHRLLARINYLDHLQILLWGGPDDFVGNATIMAALERRLQRHLNFATDSEFGSISRDIHSLGSGVNIGCFLHLPATLFEQKINATANACDALHVRFSSLFHKEEHDDGGIYSIRTYNAMGDTLANKCQLIRRTALQLERHELEARDALRKHPEHRLRLIDRIARAVAVTRNARLMETDEARKYLSLFWFGAEIGMLPQIDFGRLYVSYMGLGARDSRGSGAAGTSVSSARIIATLLRFILLAKEPVE